MPVASAYKPRVAANVWGWSRCPVGPHRAAPRGSPRHALQLRRKQLPISETLLIKDADEGLPRLSVFLGIIINHPYVEQSHKFQALVVEWQVGVQEFQGVCVEWEPLALGFFSGVVPVLAADAVLKS